MINELILISVWIGVCCLILAIGGAIADSLQRVFDNVSIKWLAKLWAFRDRYSCR